MSRTILRGNQFPLPVAGTSTYLQVERLSRFTQHLLKFHKNIQPGIFDTVNGRGRYIASAVALKTPPPRKGSENRVEGLYALSSPPIAQDPMTPTSLGRSSLKRRQSESVSEEPDQSPLAKRGRGADSEDKNVEDILTWDVVISKLRSMAQPSNEPQSVPMEEVSTTRARSESPPPPPPPCDPPPVSRITIPYHEPITPSTFIRPESPITPFMQIDNPMELTNPSSTTQPSYVLNPPTNSNPIVTDPLPQPLENSSDSRPVFVPVPSEEHRNLIVRMHQEGLYPPLKIQRAFRRHKKLVFSIETIENVIKSQPTNQSPTERENSATMANTSQNGSHVTMERENTIIMSATQKENATITQSEIATQMQLENTSNSTTSKSAGHPLNTLATNETQPDNTRRTRTETPSTPEPTNPQPRNDSPPIAPPPDLVQSLQDLSPEEALHKLEAIQASLPHLLERQRRLLREIEEEKQREIERKRKQEEEEARLTAEIAEVTRELKNHEIARREKEEELARLRQRLIRRQTEALPRYFPSVIDGLVNFSSNGSTPVAETTSNSESREGSQQRQQPEEAVVVQNSTQEDMLVEQREASQAPTEILPNEIVRNDTPREESVIEQPSEHVSRGGSMEAPAAVDDMVIESSTNEKIATELQHVPSESQKADTTIETPSENSSSEENGSSEVQIRPTDEELPTKTTTMDTTTTDTTTTMTTENTTTTDNTTMTASDTTTSETALVVPRAQQVTNETLEVEEPMEELEHLEHLEQPEVEPMEIEEEPFSMIQAAKQESPEAMDVEETDIQVVGLGTETEIQVVGSGGMTFSPPEYTSDNESEHSDGMHLDTPLQDRIHDDEKQSLSTRDSRSPSFVDQHSPYQSTSEDRPTVPRRGTFGFTESTEDTTLKFPPRRESFPVEKRTLFAQGSHDQPSTFQSLISRISTPPIDRPFTPPTGLARPTHPPRPTRGVVSSEYLNVSAPARVLLLNQFPGWSDYFVALGRDGHIELLDSKAHGRFDVPVLWDSDYTSSSAVNGAWIGPGELALLHLNSRLLPRTINKQVTLVKYSQRTGHWTKPKVTQLNSLPHSPNVKTTALEPLWEGRDGKRVFATGGNCVARD